MYHFIREDYFNILWQQLLTTVNNSDIIYLLSQEQKARIGFSITLNKDIKNGILLNKLYFLHQGIQ